MTLAPPPGKYDGTPNRYELPRGTRLWRVHSQEYPAAAFNPTRARVLYGGSRFDPTADDPYPYLYAALDDTTAVAETMLRDLAPDERGMRDMPVATVTGKRLSGLTLVAGLSLVSLVTGEDLAAIGQDAWLVTAPGRDYPQTRDWAHWLRRQAPWAHGLAWDSLRNRGSIAVVLFGDRLGADSGPGWEKLVLREEPQLAVDLDDGAAGTTWLAHLLSRFRATIDLFPDTKKPAP
jgi:RES domain